MPRLSWGTVGERYYQTGVDRGVLYVDVASGVAWNGLIAVSESTSGGDAMPYYIDGIKYLNRSAAQEFEGTIQAFSSPVEFDVCDGNASIYPGLQITNQRRQSFGLSYRTNVGNDIDGVNHGYKIHLVYNALAAPTSQDNATIGDSLEPMQFSWAITTTPPAMNGYAPTSHLVIDSIESGVDLMANLEAILYGTVDTQPRLPGLEELKVFFIDEGIKLKVTLLGGGLYEAKGWDVKEVDIGLFSIDNASVILPGDGTFSVGNEQAFEMVSTGPTTYLADGTSVEILTSSSFVMTSADIKDNGDGSLTIT